MSTDDQRLTDLGASAKRSHDVKATSNTHDVVMLSRVRNVHAAGQVHDASDTTRTYSVPPPRRTI